MYGLKQAAREWHKVLAELLRETANLVRRSVTLRRKSRPLAVVGRGPTKSSAISWNGCLGNGNVVCGAAGLVEGLMSWHSRQERT